MFIAKQLKESNIAEYLLYMWQVEDLIRANGLDIERIKDSIIRPYELDEERKRELTQWYEDLIDMMRREGVAQSGHLQINKNIIILLTDLHLRLLRSPKIPNYGANYYHVLPYIVEIRARGDRRDVPEIENCFDALYGVMLLKLQKREVSRETAAAVAEISRFIALLAAYYKKEKNGELDELLADE